MNPLKITVGLVVLSALAVTGTVFAGIDPPDPKLSKEVTDLYCLIGNWRGTFVAELGPQKANVQGSIACQKASGGFGVSCKTHFSGLPGNTSADETDLFGYDASAKKYHWFAVTSLGETHDHVAELPTGNTVTWVYRGTQDGKPMVETIRMKFDGEKRIEFENEGTIGGQRAWFFGGPMLKR